MINDIIKCIEEDLKDKGSVNNYCILLYTNSELPFSSFNELHELNIELLKIAPGFSINKAYLDIRIKIAINNSITQVITIENQSEKNKLESLYDLLVNNDSNKISNEIFINIEKKDKVNHFICEIKDNKVVILKEICNLKKKFFNFYN